MINPISRISAMAVFSIYLSHQPGNHPSSATQYCNRRFEYCLDYPASLFPERYLSAQSDTILLHSVGQIAELSVVGKLGAGKDLPEENFTQTLQGIERKNGKSHVISTLFGEDFYEANFLCGDHTYHQKAGFSAQRSVLLTIKVPMNRPELMAGLKTDVDLSFE